MKAAILLTTQCFQLHFLFLHWVMCVYIVDLFKPSICPTIFNIHKLLIKCWHFSKNLLNHLTKLSCGFIKTQQWEIGIACCSLPYTETPFLACSTSALSSNINYIPKNLHGFELDILFVSRSLRPPLLCCFNFSVIVLSSVKKECSLRMNYCLHDPNLFMKTEHKKNYKGETKIKLAISETKTLPLRHKNNLYLLVLASLFDFYADCFSIN